MKSSFHNSFNSYRNVKQTSREIMHSTYRKKPQNYRVILKNRNGSLAQNLNESRTCTLKQQYGLRASGSLNNLGNSSQVSIVNDEEPNKKQIKDFVKTMKSEKKQVKPQLKTRHNLNKLNSLQKPNSRLNKTMMQFHNPQDKNRSNQLNNQTITSQQKYRTIPIDIEEIQKRIDTLIQMKLAAAKPWQKRQSHSNSIKNKIDSQISEIVEYLRAEINTNSSDNNKNLEDINKKIEILEKLMAESSTQSEILKKYFHRQKTNKISNHSSKRYSTSTKLFNTLKYINSNINNQTSITPGLLQKQSLARSSYKPPSTRDYPLKPLPAKYQFRHQSLPRSTYSRDYLMCGASPSFQYKEYANNFMASDSRAKLSSSYQQQFTSKMVQSLNYRELDCYRDKFKNLKVPLITRKTEGSETMNKNPICQQNNRNILKSYSSMVKNKKTERNKINSVEPRSIIQKDYMKKICSESRCNFQGSKPVIKSLIKHKNLNCLKYSYKMQMHA